MYELQYLPLALPFFLFLVGLFLFIVVLIQIRVLQYAYTKLGLSSGDQCQHRRLLQCAYARRRWRKLAIARRVDLPVPNTLRRRGTRCESNNLRVGEHDGLNAKMRRDLGLRLPWLL